MRGIPTVTFCPSSGNWICGAVCGALLFAFSAAFHASAGTHTFGVGPIATASPDEDSDDLFVASEFSTGDAPSIGDNDQCSGRTPGRRSRPRHMMRRRVSRRIRAGHDNGFGLCHTSVEEALGLRPRLQPRLIHRHPDGAIQATRFHRETVRRI